MLRASPTGKPAQPLPGSVGNRQDGITADIADTYEGSTVYRKSQNYRLVAGKIVDLLLSGRDGFGIGGMRADDKRQRASCHQ